MFFLAVGFGQAESSKKHFLLLLTVYSSSIIFNKTCLASSMKVTSDSHYLKNIVRFEKILHLLPPLELSLYKIAKNVIISFINIDSHTYMSQNYLPWFLQSRAQPPVFSSLRTVPLKQAFYLIVQKGHKTLTKRKRKWKSYYSINENFIPSMTSIQSFIVLKEHFTQNQPISFPASESWLSKAGLQ